MSDYVKLIGEGLGIINKIQDNVEDALPNRSDLAEGILLENVDITSTPINHGLGRQALGAIVVKQSDATNPILVTGLSSTAITVSGSATGTASFWVF
jgi:hypothetical protein